MNPSVFVSMDPEIPSNSSLIPRNPFYCQLWLSTFDVELNLVLISLRSQETAKWLAEFSKEESTTTREYVSISNPFGNVSRWRLNFPTV